MFDVHVRSAAHIARTTARFISARAGHPRQSALFGHGFHRRINALTSPTLIPSRDCDCEDCAFDGAYFRIAASWRSSEPDERLVPTTGMGGDEDFGSRMGIKSNRSRRRNRAVDTTVATAPRRAEPTRSPPCRRCGAIDPDRTRYVLRTSRDRSARAEPLPADRAANYR